MTAATSAPTPPVRLSSWTMHTRPVFLTDSRDVAVSKGATVRRSTTSQLIPSVDKISAASRQWCTASP